MGQKPESRTGTTLLVLLRDPTNPEAWEAFVDRYGPKILGWCRRWHLQKEDAEDVTQDVLVRLAQHLHTYNPKKGRFRSWLKRVTGNAWRDFRKKRRRAGWGSGDPETQRFLENQEADDSLVRALEEEFDRELLEEAKARVQLRVKPSTWEAFELVAVEGWPGADVAAKLSLPVAAVYVAKARVQKMLREEVQQLEGADPEGGEDSR
jgi:RNA polymerase sigma-70 factor (ECF subfamily)